jgi:hypothetical protein
LPIKRSRIPIAKRDKALNDLCFLYPKHKLERPNTKDVANINHSNFSWVNNDILNTGNNINTIGKIVQCIAHSIDENIPSLSSLFILLILLPVCKL